MNASITPPPIDETPFAVAPRPATLPEPPVHLPRLFIGLALAVAVFDLCFWNCNNWPGLSLAVFVTALAGAILVNRRTATWNHRALLILTLLALSIFAAVVETGTTNTLALLMLLVALAGETYFDQTESSWGRWLSQVVALAFAPGRVFWLGARVLECSRGTGSVLGTALLALPALLLALVFGSLLASGNAVFGSWTNSFFSWVWKELALYLDPARIFAWLVVAVAALPLLRPAQISEFWWKWTASLPRFEAVLPTRAETISSGMVLVVLNLLFLAANVADALFLWSGQALPVGLDFKGYLHEGVDTLIFTVILSAIVLTAIFQQDLKVAQNRGLKVLAFAWIAQNLFLMLSVSEKLRRYIVTNEMTVERLSTIIFLILVAVGFVLLMIKISRDRSISWLIGGCALAVFGILFITQFLDLAGWSASYNEARWESDGTGHFNASYAVTMGPASWPALRRAHDRDPSDNDFTTAWQKASQDLNQAGTMWSDWREFSLRAWMNRGALQEMQNN
jgi:hypothetical protein